MNRLWGIVLVAASGLTIAGLCRADIIEYRLGGDLKILLQGKVDPLQGGTISFRHGKFGRLYFSREQLGSRQIEIHKVDTLPQQYLKQLSRAQATKSADAVFKAADWALRHGMLDQFYEAIDKTLEMDPKHVEAQRIKDLKAEMEKPLGDYSKEESSLRAFVPRGEMKIATSKHFILLYDTPDRPDVDPDKPHTKKRKPRHEERLQLLERVYESFLVRFFSRGVDLQVPKERLQVVLFHQEADYKDFATRLDPFLINATGFYLPTTNISFFYDHATDERVVELQNAINELQGLKKDLIRARTGGGVIRLVDTLQFLTEVARESEDIEVVSHEATHQMAANVGLFPQHVRVPSWVHEGLAAYFESPNDGDWSGIGAVNALRIGFYRALKEDREHSNIDFIVGDQIFDYAGNVGSILHGYGQAWALTHFLMEKHFDKLMQYYRLLGEMPPDTHLSAELLTTLFNQAFGTDRAALDGQWRSYMNSLKTDEEIILAK